MAGGAVENRARSARSWVGLILPFVLVALAITVLFHVRGSSYYVERLSGSIFKWIRAQWRSEDFSNNWIMVLVAAYGVYFRRKELQAAPKGASWTGALFTVFCLGAHVLGYRAQLPRISIVMYVLSVWGASWALFGWRVAKELLFPMGYMVLCFTGYHLVHFTMRLRLLASVLAEFLLQGAGLEGVVRQGTVLVCQTRSGGFQFDVADGCSGLRSLVVMTALAAPYAYFTMKSLWRKWALFVLSVPLAMLANTIRIFTLGLVADRIGMRLAMTLYHDFSGYMVFIIAILLLMGTRNLLERDWTKKCESQQKEPPSS